MSDKPKNPHAQALGALGGKARVPKGFSKATPEQRAAWGRKGGQARAAAASRQGKNSAGAANPKIAPHSTISKTVMSADFARDSKLEKL